MIVQNSIKINKEMFTTIVIVLITVVKFKPLHKKQIYNKFEENVIAIFEKWLKSVKN